VKKPGLCLKMLIISIDIVHWSVPKVETTRIVLICHMPHS